MEKATLEKQGADASMRYGDILGQTTGQKAAYNYAGQDWKNKNEGQDWSNIFSGLGTRSELDIF